MDGKQCGVGVSGYPPRVVGYGQVAVAGVQIPATRLIVVFAPCTKSPIFIAGVACAQVT